MASTVVSQHIHFSQYLGNHTCHWRLLGRLIYPHKYLTASNQNWKKGEVNCNDEPSLFSLSNADAVLAFRNAMLLSSKVEFISDSFCDLMWKWQVCFFVWNRASRGRIKWLLCSEVEWVWVGECGRDRERQTSWSASLSSSSSSLATP